MLFINNSFLRTKKKTLLTTAAVLIVIDLFFYLLSLNGYYFISLFFPIYKVIFALHFLYVYVLLVAISKTKPIKVFWTVVGPFFILPVLIISGYLFFYLNEVSYHYISSPKLTRTVVIGCSNWSLGETNHYYDFYQKTAIPGLEKRINKDTLHIMTRYTNASDLEVLGAYEPIWVNEKEVQFASKYKQTTLHLH